MLDTVLQLGEPLRSRGITVCPLYPRQSPQAAYLTLDEALPLGFRITETDHAGTVPELTTFNPAGHDVLLYDGEELVGAKQNRILNVTVLVAAGSELRIPVSCVEQGRWSARTAAFAAAGHAASPELRARKAALLQNAPLARGIAQGEVWDAVAAKAARHGVHSPTGAQSDVFAARAHDLASLRYAFPLQPGQSGALLALPGETFCLDYLSRPDAFARLYPKLLDGYLLDALERLDRPAVKVEPLEGFAAAVANAAATRSRSAGRGDDLRLRGETVRGSGLELDSETLQISAFSTDVEEHQQSRPGRIARPSRRQ